jgi:branched-subunit amino acid transport system permease
MVEIAKALARRPKILILDEATSALTAADVEIVFHVLKQLRSEGLAIVYISHRMHESAELADDCTVYRNGRYVATFKAGTKSDEAIVEMMIGREYKSVFPTKPTRPADRSPALSVKNLSWTGRLKGIDLSVRPGSGVNTRRVIIASFAICGSCSAISGVLLAGYSTHAYQAMGDPYLLPAIAAAVLGGTHILGGRGTFLGTIAGVIFITLLQSILSVVQVPESGRQIIYGVVIVSMLLLYGRERLQQ